MVCTDWTNKRCVEENIVGFVIFFTFFVCLLATSTSALPWIWLIFSPPLVWVFNSIYSSIVTVSPDATEHVLFRPVLMLVITLQFSYTQEAIYNALMKTAMLTHTQKKIIITLLHCKGIDSSVKINTLHCPANWTERSLSRYRCLTQLCLCFYDSSVHHLAFELLCCPEINIKRKKKKLASALMVTVGLYLWKNK